MLPVMTAPLRAWLREDVRRALKARDRETVSVLRLLEDALLNEELSQSHPLDDTAAVRVLEREMKRRREAAEAFARGGRTESAERERWEAQVIAAYLPEQMSDAELEQIVRRVIDGTERQGAEGRIMGKVMAEVRGRADGTRVRDLVSCILSTA